MDFRVIKKDQQLQSNWSGGKTYELAIFPPEAKYLNRDFLWRLSTANSDREESSFTKLTDYDRILMVLEGDVVLAHADERSVHLKALEQDRFDGGIKTKCFGKLIRDYNLIYAKGAKAQMQLQTLHSKAQVIPMSSEAMDSVASYGIFCLEGYAVVSCGETSEMIRPEEQCVIDFPQGVSCDISVMGEGRCILTEVVMGRVKDAEDPQDGAPAGGGPERPDPHAKVGPSSRPAGDAPDAASSQDTPAFADYKACLKLYFSRNRWSMLLRREGRSKVYYDRALSEALQKIERRYVTIVVWIAGMILCALPALAGLSLYAEAAILVLFTLLHVFLIAPCIYMKALPRPLSAHMKDVDQLNAAEHAYHEEEIRNDPHFEKLMRKYRSDDENYFTDESSPLFRFVEKK